MWVFALPTPRIVLLQILHTVIWFRFSCFLLWVCKLSSATNIRCERKGYILLSIVQIKREYMNCESESYSNKGIGKFYTPIGRQLVCSVRDLSCVYCIIADTSSWLCTICILLSWQISFRVHKIVIPYSVLCALY